MMIRFIVRSMHVLFACLFVFLVMSFSTRVFADDAASITFDDVVVVDGSGGYVPIYFENVTDLAAISFSFYYDASQFSADFSIVDPLLSGSFVDITDGLYPGQVHVSVTSADGINGSGQALRIYLHCLPYAPMGTSQAFLAVNEAYDTNLNPLTVKGHIGYLSLVPYTEPTNQVSIQSNISDNHVCMGDTFNYFVYSYQTYDLAAGTIEIRYDATLFAVSNITLGNVLTGLHTLVSVEDETEGIIVISFASLDGFSYANPMVTVSFVVLQDTSGETQIHVSARNLYREDLVPIEGLGSTVTMFLDPILTTPDNPDMTISSFLGPYQQSEFTLDVSLDENSGLAAGDFVIHYNPTLFSAVDVQIADAFLATGAYISTNPNMDSGEIRFSIIHEDGIQTGVTILHVTFLNQNLGVPIQDSITITGSGVVNSNFESLSLDYQNGDITFAHFVEVVYRDYDNSILQYDYVPDFDLPQAPEATYRDGTHFSEWSVVSQTYDSIQYQAVYVLFEEEIEFDDLTITYDGFTHSIFVENPIDGATYLYGGNGVSSVGTYEVGLYVALDGVFQFWIYKNITILPKPITLTIDNHSIVYGNDTWKGTFELDGLVGSDDLDIEIVSNSGFEVGNHILDATFSAPNYDVTVVTGTLTVTPAPITITAEDKESIYGEEMVPFTYLVSGNVYDELEITLTKSEGMNVGEYDILVFAENPNYLMTLVRGTYTILKAEYDLSGICFDEDTLTYDATMHSVIISGTLPEGVTVHYLGNGQIHVGDYSITAVFSHSNENYEDIENWTSTLTILPSPITITAEDKESVYGEDLVELTYSVFGALYDELEITLTKSVGADVGEYVIEVEASDANYDITLVNGIYEIHLTRYDMSAISLEDEWKVYDGSTHFIHITGTLPEGVSVSYLGNNQIQSGIYTVTAVFSHTNPNYDEIDDMQATLTISPAPITITAEDKDSVYGEDLDSLTYSIQGTIYDELEVSLVKETGLDAGEYVISIIAKDSNYEITFVEGTYTILQASYDMSRILFEDREFVYDGMTHSLMVIGNLPEGVSVNYVGNTQVKANEYPVEAIFTHFNPNYEAIDSMSATLTIAKVSITITAEDKESIYGEEMVPLTYLVAGNVYDELEVTLTKSEGMNAGEYDILVFAENPNYLITLVRGTYTILKAEYDLSGFEFLDVEARFTGEIQPIYVSGALPEWIQVEYLNNDAWDLGEHIVTVTFSHMNPNYQAIPPMTATITIVPNILSNIVFENLVIIYDGQSHAVVPSGNLEGVSYDLLDPYFQVGTYDYEVTFTKYGYVDLTLSATLTIEKASITITADSLQSHYGEAIETLTYTILGEVYDELEVSLVKAPGTDLGSYVITVTCEHPNYTITLVNGMYQILGDTVNMTGISFEDQSVVYDNISHELRIQGTIPLGIDTIQYTDNSLTHVGTLLVTVTFTVFPGYYPVDSMTATLTVTPSEITGIVFENATYIYDGSEHEIRLSSTLSQYGDELSITYDGGFSHANAGEYEVTATISHPDYVTQTLTATLTIQKAPTIIEESDFTLVISSNQFSLITDLDSARIRIALDGSNFIHGTVYEGLIENSEYEVTIYLDETTNVSMSNVISIFFQTPLSLSTFTNHASSVPTGIVGRDELVALISSLEDLSNTDRDAGQLLVDQLIGLYQDEVATIRAEYAPFEAIREASAPPIPLADGLNVAWVVWDLERRRRG